MKSEAKFTPGPWVACEWSGHAATTVKAGGVVVAECAGHGRRADESIADANLIAAAPELVEALRKLANEAAGFLSLSDIERHGMTNSRILRDRIEEARDVIAKLEIPTPGSTHESTDSR